MGCRPLCVGCLLVSLPTGTRQGSRRHQAGHRGRPPPSKKRRGSHRHQAGRRGSSARALRLSPVRRPGRQHPARRRRPGALDRSRPTPSTLFPRRGLQRKKGSRTDLPPLPTSRPGSGRAPPPLFHSISSRRRSRSKPTTRGWRRAGRLLPLARPSPPIEVERRRRGRVVFCESGRLQRGLLLRWRSSAAVEVASSSASLGASSAAFSSDGGRAPP
jgi:hypothetical protein